MTRGRKRRPVLQSHAVRDFANAGGLRKVARCASYLAEVTAFGTVFLLRVLRLALHSMG